MSEREKLRDAVVEEVHRVIKARDGNRFTGCPMCAALDKLEDAVRALDAAERPRFEARCGAVQQVVGIACDLPTQPAIVTVVHDGRLRDCDVADALNEHFEKEKP